MKTKEQNRLWRSGWQWSKCACSKKSIIHDHGVIYSSPATTILRLQMYFEMFSVKSYERCNNNSLRTSSASASCEPNLKRQGLALLDQQRLQRRCDIVGRWIDPAAVPGGGSTRHIPPLCRPLSKRCGQLGN